MALNKDFYRDLPSMVCALLDNMITKYKNEPWFEEAWQKYRKHVQTSSIDDMKMPGFIFNQYTKDKPKVKHSMKGEKFKMVYLTTSDELYHHGILGMKWGIRRFQNPDGSLTPEGLRRYRKDASGKYVKRTFAERRAYDKKMKQAAAAEKAKRLKSPRNKDIKEMTDKQLQKYIARMRLEKDAIDIRNTVNQLDPKPVSRGEQFTKMMMDKVVIPAMQDAGKRFVDAAIKSMTEQPKTVDKYTQAEKDSKYWNNLKNIENSKADYNKTKHLNDEYNKKKDTSVYFNNKNNQGKDKGNGGGKNTPASDFKSPEQRQKALNQLNNGKSAEEVSKGFNIDIEVIKKLQN